MNNVEKALVNKFWNQFIPYKVDGYNNIYNAKEIPVKPGIERKVNFLGVDPGVSIVINLNKNNTNVALVIYEKDRSEDDNTKIMSYLKTSSYEIHKELANKIVWENKSGKLRKVARITNDELSYTKQGNWAEINDWCIKTSHVLEQLAKEALGNYKD